MKIASDFSQLIGNTPLLRVGRYISEYELKAEVLAKLELFNPAGSIKDRAAVYMIKEAESRGAIKKGAVIIEPTSGNTGIGLAAAARSLGYRVVLTMPDTMSQERRNLLKAYGAELVLTEGKDGMTGAIKKAFELSKETENSFIPSQFENPANAKAHYETTGPEIWADSDGKADIIVAGIGTGGTITGTGRYLKEKNRDIKVVGVEPFSSQVLKGEKAGGHKIQGIGANFVPDLLDRSIIDEIIPIKNEDAYKATADMAALEGILVGISSGAALFAAAELAQRRENFGKTIVAIMPDTGEHYLSTGVFE